MKATGIVRRIDDLGRVVIPRELRRTMRIHEGDPLEIFTSNDGEVVFKKYYPEQEYANQLKAIRDDIANSSMDRDMKEPTIRALNAALVELEDKL